MKDRIPYLDGLRAVAILAVIAHHTLTSTLYHIPRLLAVGAHGIDLFFVVSGLCLSLGPLQKWHMTGNTAFSFRHFAHNRFYRIVPPFLIALALFAALSLTNFGLPTSAISTKGSGIELLREASLLTMGFPTPYNTTNWTLGLESRWYLAFPFLLALYASSRARFIVLGLALYIAYYATSCAMDIGILPCFMLGIIASDLIITKHPLRRHAWVGVVLFALLAGAQQQITGVLDFAFPAWHLFAFFIAIYASTLSSSFLTSRFMVSIGKASYSLYLVHLPILIWLAFHGVPAVLALGATMAAGFAFYHFVELPLSNNSSRQVPLSLHPQAAQTVLEAPLV